MFRIIGIITVTIAIAWSILLLEKYSGGNFISEVLFKESLSIFATILGLQLATASFLLNSLSTHEVRLGTNIFDGTRSEMKTNLYVLIFLFLLALIMVVFNADPDKYLIFQLKKLMLVSILLLSIFSFYDIVRAMFSIDNTIKNI